MGLEGEKIFLEGKIFHVVTLIYIFSTSNLHEIYMTQCKSHVGKNISKILHEIYIEHQIFWHILSIKYFCTIVNPLLALSNK